MDCEQCETCLIDHVHGELEPAPRAAVTRHLAECAGCAVAFCRLRADLDGLLAATEVAPPAAVRASLRAEVERSFRPNWWRRALAQVRRPVPAYAVALALAIPAVVWFARAPERSPVTSASPAKLQGYDAAAPLTTPRTIL